MVIKNINRFSNPALTLIKLYIGFANVAFCTFQSFLYFRLHSENGDEFPFCFIYFALPDLMVSPLIIISIYHDFLMNHRHVRPNGHYSYSFL